MFSEIRTRAKKAGFPPGTPHYTGERKIQEPVITVLTYNGTKAHERSGHKIADILPLKEKGLMTWINVEGLSDVNVVNELAKIFQLHPLTIEDILNIEQRPKVEEFDHYTFITLKVLSWKKNVADFDIAQLSLVIGDDFILSFQEEDTTRFDELRKRIEGTGLREQGTDYLAYRMMDNVIDEYFFVLEAIGNEIEVLEQRIIVSQKPKNAGMIYHLKRNMLLLRKAIWPMREAINHLLYTDNELISESTRIYLRDIYDHTMQAIDTLETFRDMLASMLDMYLSTLTIRMNEIMKTLTIITTIFIPIAAIAGIYGMNITNIPMIKSPWAFQFVFSLMIIIAVTMLIYFKKKKWF